MDFAVEQFRRRSACPFASFCRGASDEKPRNEQERNPATFYFHIAKHKPRKKRQPMEQLSI
jgi:hypothetical protein